MGQKRRHDPAKDHADRRGDLSQGLGPERKPTPEDVVREAGAERDQAAKQDTHELGPDRGSILQTFSQKSLKEGIFERGKPQARGRPENQGRRHAAQPGDRRVVNLPLARMIDGPGLSRQQLPAGPAPWWRRRSRREWSESRKGSW